jgi:carbon monoxide dehydrogenase subunit G
MKISGSFTFEHPVKNLWEVLSNPYEFGSLSSNIQRVEKIEEEMFRIDGNFSIAGNVKHVSFCVQLIQQEKPEFIYLMIKGLGFLSTVSAEATIRLQMISEGTSLASYSVIPKWSLFMKSMFGGMADNLINKLALEFFQSLNERLKMQ